MSCACCCCESAACYLNRTGTEVSGPDLLSLSYLQCSNIDSNASDPPLQKPSLGYAQEKRSNYAISTPSTCIQPSPHAHSPSHDSSHLHRIYILLTQFAPSPPLKSTPSNPPLTTSTHHTAQHLDPDPNPFGPSPHPATKLPAIEHSAASTPNHGTTTRVGVKVPENF